MLMQIWLFRSITLSLCCVSRDQTIRTKLLPSSCSCVLHWHCGKLEEITLKTRHISGKWAWPCMLFSAGCLWAAAWLPGPNIRELCGNDVGNRRIRIIQLACVLCVGTCLTSTIHQCVLWGELSDLCALYGKLSDFPNSPMLPIQKNEFRYVESRKVKFTQSLIKAAQTSTA